MTDSGDKNHVTSGGGDTAFALSRHRLQLLRRINESRGDKGTVQALRELQAEVARLHAEVSRFHGRGAP